jgi:transcriptional regulator with XRE-family HTH domain
MEDEERRRCTGRGGSRKSGHVDVRLGARVRQRRTALGFTLQELGSKAGVSLQQMQKYEAGDIRISASRLHVIARVLGIPITWFFLPETGSQPELAQETSPQQEADRLASLFSAIEDPRVRHAIMELVTLLADMPGKSTVPRL